MIEILRVVVRNGVVGGTGETNICDAMVIVGAPVLVVINVVVVGA